MAKIFNELASLARSSAGISRGRVKSRKSKAGLALHPDPWILLPYAVAVVFDTPYSGWDHPDHESQIDMDMAAWKTDEPEMEYQIAHALRSGA